MRHDHGFGSRGRETSRDGYEIEHGVLAQQGINSGKSHFAHYGYTLGGVLEHEYLDVRVVQNVALTEADLQWRPALVLR